jgi:NADH:ubiquinone oxidoreductase subunit 6 (subunit J)
MKRDEAIKKRERNRTMFLFGLFDILAAIFAILAITFNQFIHIVVPLLLVVLAKGAYTILKSEQFL